MRRSLLFLLLTASCGEDQSLVYDLEPIQLARAPVFPGGPAVGGLLANVTTAAGTQPMIVDSAFPINSLARAGCAGGGAPGWTYTGKVELRDGSATAPVRAAFDHVGLFDLCPGSTGDGAPSPAGVMGGPLLTNFSVGLVLPRNPGLSASMTLWPGFPGSDDQLARNGFVSLPFNVRGGAAAAQGTGEASLTLPSSRIVLAACAAPRIFSTAEPAETCAQGEVAVKASGQDLMVAVGTGEGPLILRQSAWSRIAGQVGMASDAGTSGNLYTPFSSTPTPARFLTLSRLAVFQGIPDGGWMGPCAELARARRIEWALGNQATGACIQPCDASGSHALATHAYLELGDALDVAVVSETSEVIRSINSDAPPNPQVDGIIGAGTLAGTRIRLDYTAQPQARVLAFCEEGSTRSQCWTAPTCPGQPATNQVCFGQPVPGWPNVCP